MPLPDPKAILFDLDGTLLDSFAGHLRAYQAAFVRLGYRLTAPEFHRHYHPDWNRFYQAIGLPADRWDTLSSYWREAAEAEPAPPPFPEVALTLEALGRRAQLAVVTSGSRPRVDVDLRQAHLAKHFAVIVTGDEVKEPKPAPDGVLLALRSLSIEPSEALYVGDTLVDEELARRAGVAFVAIASAFTRGPFRGVRRPLTSVGDLPQVLGWV